MIKIKGKDDKEIFFTSDAHLNQKCDGPHWAGKELWRTRGYSSPEEHLEGWIKNFNSTCNEESIVFHVGDFMFHCLNESLFLSVVSRLKFKQMYFSLGNHNAGQKCIYKSELKRLFPDLEEDLEIYPLCSTILGKEIIFLPHYFELEVGPTFFAVSHFPILSHASMAKGIKSIHIAAHTHQNLDLTHPEKGCGFRIDVGFDYFKKPVSIFEIKNILSKRKSADVRDHHTEITY